MPPLRGVELEVTDGITEHSSRVALKGVFSNFGDVVACWVPPIDRRGRDNASIRFAMGEAAEAAKIACDAGQVFLQGMQLKVSFRTGGGGRRVGNSDLGSEAASDTGSMALRDLPQQRDRRSRSRRRRSGSRRRYRSRSVRREERNLDRTPAGVSIAPPVSVALAAAPVVALPSDPHAMPDWLVGAEAPNPMLQDLSLGVMTPQVAPGFLGQPLSAAAAAAAYENAFPVFDPEENAKRRAEMDAKKKERASQMKRGPGVAALVQEALKRAQNTATVPKKDAAQPQPKPHAVEESDEESEENEEKRARRDKEEQKYALEQEDELKRARERTVRETQEKEKADLEARERREIRRKEEAEAENELQKREAETRDQRIKASVEAAKRQQAERSAAKAAKEAAGNLYSDMPQPDLESERKQQEVRLKEAEQRQKQMNLTNLPPEDRSKVIFLDVDGVLRPARAGGFDIVSVDGDAASSRIDTSDFFASAWKALRHIVERTGAVLVLSSEWRRSEALRGALADTLEKNRLRPWGSITPSNLELEPGPDPVRQFADRRAREIGRWLQEQEKEVSGWVVLDDINIAIVDEVTKKTQNKKDALGPHLVQTWPLCGLTMGNAKTAVRILNGEMINKVVVERPVAPAPSGLSTPMPGRTAGGLATPMPGAGRSLRGSIV